MERQIDSKSEEERLLRKELDGIKFGILQASCPSFKGMSLDSYRQLVATERELVADPKPRETSVDKVIQDLELYGENPATAILFVRTFLDNTRKDTRTASVCGRHDKIVYLSQGIWTKDDKAQFGLLSAHVPGSSGGGGCGMNGDRRICFAYPLTERLADPEQWLKETVAQAYELPGGDIDYLGKDRGYARTLFGTVLFGITKSKMKGGSENNE